MSEKTFQQKFGAFALVAAVVLLSVNCSRAYGVRYLHAATARSHGHHYDAR